MRYWGDFMYTYYEKVETEAHYLYSTEIASWLRLYSKEGKLHHSAMITYLMNLLEEQNGLRPLYYKTATAGLRRVCRTETATKICALISSSITVENEPVKVNIAGKSFICMRITKTKEGVA